MEIFSSFLVFFIFLSVLPAEVLRPELNYSTSRLGMLFGQGI